MSDTTRPDRVTLGMVGLGRMGANLVRRAMADGHSCVVYDPQAQAVAEAGVPIEAEGGQAEEHGDAEVLAAGDEFEAAVVDLAPVGFFAGHDGVAHLLLGLALGQAHDFEVAPVVAQLLAAGGGVGDGTQKTFNVDGHA